MLEIWKWKIPNFQVNFLAADKKYICPLIFALPTTHFVISLLLELTTTVIFRSTLSPIVLASAVSVARRSLLSLRTLFSPFDNKRVSRTRGFFIGLKIMLIFVLTHSKGLLPFDPALFQFVLGSPQKRFRDAQVLLSVPYEHLSLCIPYYMNVIPTNLKVRCH